MIPYTAMGAIFALSSALIYGSADFFGGIATRRNNAFAVLTLSSVIGMIPMALLGFLVNEKFPDANAFLWSCMAGAAGTFGLAILYFGLANGSPIIVSPISGIIGASLPVIYSLFIKEFPTLFQISGFVFAVPTIYLLSQTKSKIDKDRLASEFQQFRTSLLWGISAGIFFGFFFIALAQITKESFFYPLAISKLISFVLSLSFTLISHQPLPNIYKNPAVILAGILDPTANGLYLLAVQFTRIDIAAVLASLYPTGTILMAFLFQKEVITKHQIIGIGLCMVSIVLIMS